MNFKHSSTFTYTLCAVTEDETNFRQRIMRDERMQKESGRRFMLRVVTNLANKSYYGLKKQLQSHFLSRKKIQTI
jgi:hypothetical protein